MNTNNQTSNLAKIDSLRIELLEELPKAKQLITCFKKIHRVYITIYQVADKVILPEILLSELKFHVKHHFGMLQFVIDELRFILDGKIVRSNKAKLVAIREYIHPSRFNDFILNNDDFNQKETSVSLYTKSIQGYFYEETQFVAENSKKTISSEDVLVLIRGEAVEHMRLELLMLEEEITQMRGELCNVWKAEGNFEDELIKIDERNNSFGVSFDFRRAELITFMSFNYKVFIHSILNDQNIVFHKNYEAGLNVAELFKRFDEVTDAIESVERRPQRSGLDIALRQELQEIESRIDDIKMHVQKRVSKIDSDGFMELVMFAVEEDDTVVMSVLPEVDSDVDSDDGSDLCPATKSSMAAMAARRVCDHIVRYNDQCGANVEKTVDAMKVGNKMMVSATAMLTSAYKYANAILDPRSKASSVAYIDSVQRAMCRMTKCGILDTVSREVSRSFTQLSESEDDESDYKSCEEDEEVDDGGEDEEDNEDEEYIEQDVLVVPVSSLDVEVNTTPSRITGKTKRCDLTEELDVTPMSPPLKKIRALDESDFSKVIDLISSGDANWWSDDASSPSFPAVSFTPIEVKFSRCDLFVARDLDMYIGNNDVLDFESDQDEDSVVEDVCNSQFEEVKEDELTDDEDEDTPKIEENNDSPLLIKKLLFKQAKEVKLIQEHELVRRKDLTAKLRSKLNALEDEFKIRRERLNLRHYNIFLDFIGVRNF